MIKEDNECFIKKTTFGCGVIIYWQYLVYSKPSHIHCEIFLNIYLR